MYNTLNESVVFLGCVYGGLCIGILYDFFFILSLPLKSRILLEFLDLLFYGAAAVIAALFLLYLNGGRLRLYALLAFIGAAFFYRYTAGALLRGLLLWLKRRISHFCPCEAPRDGT